jgi:predicted CXXCH cytochrome family protein
MAEALLVRDQPALCAGCHEVEGEAVLEAHAGFPVAEARCTGCHDPHVSRNPKLVADVGHPPFGDRDCSTCHERPGAGTAAAPLKRDLLARCDDCHDFAARAKAVKVAHAPVKAGRCFECHTPHASPREHLLLKAQPELCYGCHEKARAAFAQPHVHTAVRRGQCAGCHAIHGGKEKKLLARTGAELCFECHAGEKKLLEERWVHEPFRSGDCESCHDPHASPHAAQLEDALPQLCTNCHDLAEKKAKEKHAGLAAGAACATCHSPHGAPAAARPPAR